MVRPLSLKLSCWNLIPSSTRTPGTGVRSSAACAAVRAKSISTDAVFTPGGEKLASRQLWSVLQIPTLLLKISNSGDVARNGDRVTARIHAQLVIKIPLLLRRSVNVG